MPAVAVAIQNASKRFGPVEAFTNIDLTIAPGSFVAIVGPSGCGKTTLLRAIGGVEAISAGSIALRDENGAALTSDVAHISFCFQEPRLLPWRSVLGNVELPLELSGVPVAERRTRALEVIGRMRLSDAATRTPPQLSGGMRMRVAMARALVTQPRLLLLDEPFGALDEVTRYQLDEELVALQRSERFTTILVTHSLTEAVFLADRVEVLSPRPGRILWSEDVRLARRDDEARTSDAFSGHVRRVSDALHRGLEAVRARIAAGAAQ